MLVSLIAAVSDDGFISRGGRIPWRLPRDIQHFRSYVAGKWLLLGRTTYQEMTGWFSDHKPIVLTRDRTFRPHLGMAAATVEEALKLARDGGAQELVVCGGGEVFATALPVVHRMILTRVHTAVRDGVRFPDFVREEWIEEDRRDFSADAENALAMSIVTLRRRDST
jgi:dihydrofolate reductase